MCQRVVSFVISEIQTEDTPTNKEKKSLANLCLNDSNYWKY